MRTIHPTRVRVAALVLALALSAAAATTWTCGRDLPTLGAGVDPGTPSPPDVWQRRWNDTQVVLGELPASDFCEVVAALQLEAQTRLAERAWDVLTVAELTRYSGARLRAPAPGRVAVLLRCVQASPHPDEHSDHDRTQVLGNAGYFVVRFTTLRAHYTPPLRKALVAIVSTEPYDVYVETLVAIY